jgi:hypothetical protein
MSTLGFLTDLHISSVNSDLDGVEERKTILEGISKKIHGALHFHDTTSEDPGNDIEDLVELLSKCGVVFNA